MEQPPKEITPILKTPFTDRVMLSIGSPKSLIAHTIIFILFFVAAATGFISFERSLLILTTAVSLEAIYMAILIQIAVNRNTQSLLDVGEEIEDIEENLEEIQEDVGEIQEDVAEVQEDVGEIQEDLEEDGMKPSLNHIVSEVTIEKIKSDLEQLLRDIEVLKGK